MHDIRLIRDDPEAFDAMLARRSFSEIKAQDILDRDTLWRSLTTKVEEIQADLNATS